MTPKLALEHLNKSYASVQALRDLSIVVPRGCVFGLLGRNGAGKTTTIACTLGLARPDSGTILVDGHAPTPADFHDIAYVPETPAFDSWINGGQCIEYHRRVYQHFDARRATQLAKLFNLPLNRSSRRLSNGQRTALALVLAFAQQAELIVLDEPAAGLDPYAQQSLLELIVKANADGATILFSSHQIGHVERAAEAVAIVDRGSVRLQGAVDDLCTDHRVIEATFAQPPDLTQLRNEPFITGVEDKGVLVRIRVAGNADSAVRLVQQLGAQTVRTINQSLEEIFLNVV